MYRSLSMGALAHPAAIWLGSLVLIGSAECLVMLLLPLFFNDMPSRLWEALLDTMLLTLIVAPAMWWLLVRPLRQAVRLRATFASKLIEATESERRRVARELHDGVGQLLTMLLSGMRSLPPPSQVQPGYERIPDLRKLAEGALKEVKRLSLALRPSVLDDLGLISAIEKLADDILSGSGLPVTLDVGPLTNVRLPGEVEIGLFRICQEALNNAVRHADARNASVTLHQTGDLVTLIVSDDGKGFIPQSDGHLSGHLGLLGMEERTELLGGRLEIDSTPGEGTRVMVEVPVKVRLVP